MFAVVRTGGKQYRVAAGDKIVVEKMAGAAGDVVALGDVLFAGSGSEVRDAGSLSVTAEIIAQAKADKVIVFKKRRRHNYRRKNGHRQQHTILRITGVGDDKYVPQAKTVDAAPATGSVEVTSADAGARAAPMDVTTNMGDVADTAPVAKKPRAKKAAAPVASPDPQPQEPLKVEGATSAMTDTPASTDKTTES